MSMKPRSPDTAGFTLLELVVVLGILATVTLLAIRAVDGVQDQHRFEASTRILEDIEAAVLGSPEDRAPDGTPTISGFLADIYRSGAQLTLSFYPRPGAGAAVVTLNASSGGEWSGELSEGGDRTAVTLRRD